jgi:SAM-dependent methyltransferase
MGVSIDPPNRGVFGQALEIGCGLGMLAPLLMREGYHYTGIEPDSEAASWCESTFDVVVIEQPFENVTLSPDFDLIAACHVFEHMHDAPAMIAKAIGLLRPRGKLLVVVPDDSDPVNPDHRWFFTAPNLESTLRAAGAINIRTAVFRRVAHENFIYAYAECSP